VRPRRLLRWVRLVLVVGLIGVGGFGSAVALSQTRLAQDDPATATSAGGAGDPSTSSGSTDTSTTASTDTSSTGTTSSGTTTTTGTTDTGTTDTSTTETGTTDGTTVASAAVVGAPDNVDLSIVKSTDESTVDVGSTLRYTLSVHNAGPATAGRVVVTDTLPSGVRYSGSSLGDACTFTPTDPENASGGGTVTCDLGSLEASSDRSFTIDVVPTEPNPELGNEASVAADGQVDLNADDNSSSAFVTVGTLVDVSLTKTAPASVAAGAKFTYTLKVVNQGSKAVTGVTIDDELPEGVTFDSTSSDATCSPGDGSSSVRCGPYDLALAGTLDVKIGVTATGTGTVTNTASVSVGAGEIDTNPDDNFASADTNIAPAAPNGSGVLILDTTVSGGASSVEAKAASALGFNVDVVNSDQWAAMSRADFARYRAIILGDDFCGSFYTAAEANTGTWGPVVNGNVIINGTDPVFHGKSLVTNTGIAFATAVAGKTGAYISLSCRYNGFPGGTPVAVLDALHPGGFTVTGVPCSAAIHIVATHPALGSLTDDYLSNWGCSVHEAFQTWPSDFKVLAIAKDIGTSFTAPDGTQGTPYILARGEGLAVISDIKLAPADATNTVGDPHTLTATVTQTGGVPVVGADVTFKVVSGPNDGLTGHALTGTDGTATFTYTSRTPGTDQIQASFLDSTGKTQTSDLVTETWLAATTATITLAPATASNPVGTSHTVTATVTQGGAPVVEKTVTFSVTSGPDIGKTGTAVTNSDGNATFTYTNNGTAGTDGISASIQDGDTTRTATASKTWVAAAPLSLALAPASASNPVGTSHTVTATVTQGGAPVVEKTVTFSVTSGPDIGKTGTAVTNSDGNATFTYTNNGTAGTDSISASIQDGDTTRTATASKTWVAAAPLSLALAPASASNPVGTSHTVTATVTQDGAPVSGKSVNFSIDSGPDAGRSSSAVTNASGQASFTYTNNGTAGTDDIAASISDGDATRSAHVTKTWVAAPVPLAITLAPAEASNPVGTSHTVTATVTQDGDPVADKTVTFSIDSGPDADHGGSAVTGSDGKASFTYTNNGSVGTDSISASIQDGDTTRTATASKTWVAISAPDLQITVDVTPTSPTVGSAVTFAYHLRNKGNAPASSVNFNLTPPSNATLVSVNAVAVSPPLRRALAATFSPGCAAIGSDVTCAIGTVLPGGGSDVTMIVTPTSAGPLVSSANAGSTETTTSPQVTTVTVGPAAGGGGSGGGGSSSGGGGGGGGGSTTTTTTTTTGTGTGTVASTPSDVPPAPPPPTNPGELNAIGKGAIVNGQPVPDGQIIVLKTGDIVDVSNGGAITVTNFNGGTATFSSFQPKLNVQNGPSTGGSTQATVVSSFRVDQSTAPDVPTIATLVGGSFASCGSVRSAASANAPKTVVRELWGTAKGQFRTRARYSSATVRGTQWLTQDRCDGSLVTVTKDVVDVFDFSLKKTVTLNVGQSYLALPPRKISAVKPKKAVAKKAAKPKAKAKAKVKATAKK